MHFALPKHSSSLKARLWKPSSHLWGNVDLQAMESFWVSLSPSESFRILRKAKDLQPEKRGKTLQYALQPGKMLSPKSGRVHI